MSDICLCDVTNKESLAVFRVHRRRWVDWVCGRHKHSIATQVADLLWYDTIFRTINEARRIHVASGSDETGINGIMMELLDHSFLSSQALGIRRLTDQPLYNAKPGKESISLRSVISSISENLSVFTRENYVCHDGVPFDEPSGGDVKMRIGWECRHEYFDVLSGTMSTNRRRNDILAERSVKKLEKALDVCDVVRQYVNKFLAHASDSTTKSYSEEPLKEMTLRKLDTCYQAIVEVAWFLGEVVLREPAFGGVPVPQFDHLQGLDKPLVAGKDLTMVNDFWDGRLRDVDSWAYLDWESRFGSEMKNEREN